MAVVREATHPIIDPRINSASHKVSGTLSNTSDNVTLDCGGCEAASVSISGTYNGTIGLFEASNANGTTYAATSLVNMSNGTAVNSTGNLTNSTLMWQGDISGFDRFRVRRSQLTSGTANITISANAWKRR